MPVYDICYLNDSGQLAYQFSADCDTDMAAKVTAHAMKMPSIKRFEVWRAHELIYARGAYYIENGEGIYTAARPSSRPASAA